MSNEAINKSKTYKKTRISIARLVLFVITSLVLGRILYGLVLKNPKTEIVQYGNIELSVDSIGYIIKNETIIKSPATGTIIKLIPEGKRVKKGVNVVSIDKDVSTSVYEEKIEKIDQEIDGILSQVKSNNLFENDVIKIDALIQEKLDQASQLSKNGDINKLTKIKEEINDLLSKKQLVTGQAGFAANNIEQKNEQKELYTNQINASRIDIPTSISGIVSYNIDGSENVLLPQNIDDITVSDFEKITVKKGVEKTQILAGEPIAKLVDNFEWHIASTLKKNLIDPLKENDNINLVVNQDLTVPAKVRLIKFDDSSDKALIVFTLTNNLEQFYNLRQVDIKIVKRNYEGIKIPLSSIIEKEGKNGVLLVDKGITSFKEVDILGTDKKFAIVPSENQLSNKKGLSLYNEIIINPFNIQEGILVK